MSGVVAEGDRRHVLVDAAGQAVRGRVNADAVRPREAERQALAEGGRSQGGQTVLCEIDIESERPSDAQAVHDRE